MYKNLLDYLEKRKSNHLIVGISLDSYRENLVTSLSGLVIKREDKSREAIFKIIDCDSIKETLLEINYPYLESFMICIEQGNAKKITNHLENLENWVYKNSFNKSFIDLVENEIRPFQAIICKRDLHPEDVDLVIDSLIQKSRTVIEEIASKIESSIEKLEWGSCPILVKALPSENWISESAKIEFGSNVFSSFDLIKTSHGYVVENILMNEMPEKLKQQIQDLIQRLKESPKIKQVATLYMAKPNINRNLFENKKRQISLGIQTYLPKGTLLTNIPSHENDDIWKVKLENKNLLKYLQEGNFTGYKLVDDSQLKWIELFRSKNEE